MDKKAKKNKTTKLEVRMTDEEMENLIKLSELFKLTRPEIFRAGLRAIIFSLWKNESFNIKDRIKLLIDEGEKFENAISMSQLEIERENLKKKKTKDEILKESQVEVNKANEKLLYSQEKMIKLLSERIEMLEEEKKDTSQMELELGDIKEA